MRVKIGLLKEKGGKKMAFHGFNIAAAAAYITRSGERERIDGRDVQLPQISNPECERGIHASHECARREKLFLFPFLRRN